MHLPSLFILLVYVAAYLFLLFSAICLACGLYYLVELAEEYTTLTKKTIRITIFILLVIHVLLIIYEKFSFIPCVIGFSAHLIYLQLLKSFPFINPTSPQFLLSVFAFLLDNYIWYRYFKNDYELFYRYSVAPLPATAAFFLLVIWIVPCAFFCSLSVNDSVLPGINPQFQQNGSASMAMSGSASKTKRQNVVIIGLQSIAGSIRNLLGSGNSRRNDIF